MAALAQYVLKTVQYAVKAPLQRTSFDIVIKSDDGSSCFKKRNDIDATRLNQESVPLSTRRSLADAIKQNDARICP